MRSRGSSLAAIVVLALALVGCSAGHATATSPQPASATTAPEHSLVGPGATRPPSGTHPTHRPTIATLPTTGAVDYQLGGAYAPPAGVTIVTRDSTDSPAPGVYSICYVNGFQTQSQDASFWLTKHPTLVLRTANGTPLVDPGWPDEMILDESTAAKRAQLSSIIGSTIALCASKGFRAVEFDNLDSWQRSRGALTKADTIALASLFVATAHAKGLAAGQKNTLELGTAGRDIIHFDFAVAEECHTYTECGGYTALYGAHVMDIEYTDDLRGTFAQVCADPSTPHLTILRDRDLVPAGDPAYVYRHC